MDLNSVLIWTVGAVGSGLLLNVLGHPHPLRSAALPGLLLTTLAACVFLIPDHAGWVGAGLLLVVLLPLWLMQLVEWLLARRRYRLAGGLSQLVEWLRPTRETRGLTQLVRALQALQQGDLTHARERLDAVPASSALTFTARALRTRVTGTWQELLDQPAFSPAAQPCRRNPQDCDLYLQGLGELGRRREMLQTLAGLEHQRPAEAGGLNMIRLRAAAFCGEQQAVAELLGGPLRELPLDVKRFWRITALQAAGETEQAAAEFQWLVQHANAPLALSAQQRLNNPVLSRVDQPLDEAEQQALQTILQSISRDTRHTMVQLRSSQRSWGTWLLAGVLVFVFLCELPGGSENFANLERMGALLIPPIPGEPQAWRMVAAAFLHFGPVHLIMNLLGLIILGRVLEALWGPARMLTTYLVCAVGSIGLTPYVMSPVSPLERTVLVGASGGVMGLIGGLLIQALLTLIQGRSLPALREFASLLMVVAIQLAFDASTPNVSSEAHLLGMGIGILCGGIWNLWGSRKSGSDLPR